MTTATPYDEVPYPGYPFRQTHPDRMAVTAALFGLKTAPVESCRVLELGCGEGANLLPMALELPHSRFVGVDLSASAISKGLAVMKALGLQNIELHALDMLDVDAAFGRFDYIIAHGVYSWVPPAVQSKIFEICHANLTPHGVGYVSYNVYPGGHLTQMLREMMLFHVRGADDSQEKIAQSRALLSFLLEAQTTTDDYAHFLKRDLELISTRRDAGLFHDDLAPINAPVYFHQFIDQAAQHGLQYLGEADPVELRSRELFPLADEMFRRSGVSLLAQEQYLDFLKCRRFRQTLLCRAEAALRRPADVTAIKQCWTASSARPVSVRPDLASAGAIEKFQTPSGVAMSVNDPLVKAALACLGDLWPRWIAFDELVDAARMRIDDRHDADSGLSEERLCEALFAGYGSDMVELHRYPPSFTTLPGERPTVSPLARLQAQEGGFLTTLRHGMLELQDDLASRLILLLDGTRNRDSLIAELGPAMESTGGETVPGSQRGGLPEQLEDKLAELARLALLIA